MKNKQSIIHRSIAVAFGIALLAGACGNDDSTVAAGGDGDGGAASQGDDVGDNDSDPQDDVEPGDEPVSSPEFDRARIETDPEVADYQLGVIDHAVVDPVDDSTVLVRFVMGATPCEGARVSAEESETQVLLTLETGLHQNVAAMTCVAGVFDYEMAVRLSAPLAGRELTYNDPQPADDGLVANVDTAQFVGLEFEAATALAEEQGLVWRIARQDGESFALTEDFNPDRLNLEIDAGVVTAVENW